MARDTWQGSRCHGGKVGKLYKDIAEFQGLLSVGATLQMQPFPFKKKDALGKVNLTSNLFEEIIGSTAFEAL